MIPAAAVDKPDAKTCTAIILSFSDGSAHVMDGHELDAFLEWLRSVNAVLAAAKTLVPVWPTNGDSVQ